jgi:hypothetical protein
MTVWHTRRACALATRARMPGRCERQRHSVPSPLVGEGQERGDHEC